MASANSGKTMEEPPSLRAKTNAGQGAKEKKGTEAEKKASGTFSSWFSTSLEGACIGMVFKRYFPSYSNQWKVLEVPEVLLAGATLSLNNVANRVEIKMSYKMFSLMP